MSHCSKIKTELKDKAILKEVCKKLGIKVKENTNTSFYDGSNVYGTQIQLDGWQYPVAVKPDGEVVYDNYNGSWGDESKLNELKREYAVEKTKAIARKKGHIVKEIKQDNKTRLVITTNN